MKIYTRLLFFLLSFSSLTITYAQDLISSELVASRTKDQIISEFGVTLEPYVDFGVNMYKITYYTPDIYGVQDTASGLLIVPDDLSKKYPVLSSAHGTVGSKQDVPSNLSGGYQLPMLMAATGYYTVAADYLGLGVSKGFHPYVHADTEASASVDMLFAAHQFAEENGIHLNDQLFITGYSQGGHASMATHRLIQEEYSDDFEVTASAPNAGPYEIYGAQTDFTLGDHEFFYPAFLPYVALGYRDIYNIYTDLEEFFKPDFVPMIKDFENGTIDLSTLNDWMINKLIQDYGQSVPKYMMQDSAVNNILNDPNHPTSLALQDNNLLDWVPEAPTRLVYCEADDQVGYLNSVNASAYFNANGAPDLDDVNAHPFLNHVDCVTPATFVTLAFFANYQTVEDVTSVDNIYQLPVEMYPNPAGSFVNFNGLEQTAELRIIDLRGSAIMQSSLNTDQNTVDISVLENGVYVVEIVAEGKVWREKLIVKK